MSTQKQSTNCTNSTNSPISEIREISGCSQKTIGEIREISGPAPKISVIVPVYKVEKYLPECIESVLAQTFTDFELILVDDGSPDNSGAICDAYAARDPRIRVFHKENGGVTSARRLGVEHSRGGWIMFVDGDDMIFKEALSILWYKIDDGLDMVEGRYSNFPYPNPNASGKFEIMRFSGAKYALTLSSDSLFCFGPCGKLIRRKKFSDRTFPKPEIKWGEDVLMNLALSKEYREVAKISDEIYYYRSTGGGKYIYSEETYVDLLSGIKDLFDISDKKIIGNFSSIYLFHALGQDIQIENWSRFFSFVKKFGSFSDLKGKRRLFFRIFLKSYRLPLSLVFWRIFFKAYAAFYKKFSKITIYSFSHMQIFR